MSDREYCSKCEHIKKLKFSDLYICNYPVPYWALPPVLVSPDIARTCPVFEESYNEEI